MIGPLDKTEALLERRKGRKDSGKAANCICYIVKENEDNCNNELEFNKLHF